MPSPSDLPEPERERERLYSDLRDIGDVRPGTLNPVRHKCGKSNCVCADPSHTGHGEEYILSKKVAGKTVAAHFRPGPALDKAQREVANHKRFRGLVQEIDEVNERICEASRLALWRRISPLGRAKSKGLFKQLQANFSAEVERLSQLAGRQLFDPLAKGLASVELATRIAMIKKIQTTIDRRAETVVEGEVVLWIARQEVRAFRPDDSRWPQLASKSASPEAGSSS